MTTECCKFCGAGADIDDRGTAVWSCGSYISAGDGTEMQSGLCQKNELKAYRALFPIPPWSTEPISDATCRALGMVHGEEHKIWWMDRTGNGIHVELGQDGWEVWQIEDNAIYHEWCKTAGQLALFLAARKGAVK